MVRVCWELAVALNTLQAPARVSLKTTFAGKLNSSTEMRGGVCALCAHTHSLFLTHTHTHTHTHTGRQRVWLDSLSIQVPRETDPDGPIKRGNPVLLTGTGLCIVAAANGCAALLGPVMGSEPQAT